MSSFDDRKKSLEKKFANDQELQFKIKGRRNKYFGKWAAEKLEKKDEEIENYISDVIKADLKEPGDMDIIIKVQNDFRISKLDISEDEIKSKLDEFLEIAKADFQ